MKQANLTLETARELYKQGGASKSFALDNYSEEELNKKELPKTWEECFKGGWYVSGASHIVRQDEVITHKDEKNVVRTEAQAKGIVALTQLLQCRDEYRGEWKPDWENIGQGKWCIDFHYDKTCVKNWSYIARLFSFETREQAEAFATNFEDLLKEVKELFN